MRPEDKKHVEELCQIHGIVLLDEMGVLKELVSTNRLNLFGTSISIQKIDSTTQEVVWRGVYVIDHDDDDVDYMVTLHEMGHAALGHGDDKATSWDDMVERELQAWEWAYDHAKYFPNDEAVCDSLDALSTYTHVKDAIARGEIGTKDTDLGKIAKEHVYGNQELPSYKI